MNKILLGVAVLSFCFGSCQGKEKHKEKEPQQEVVWKQSITEEERKMDELEASKKIVVAVSGDSLSKVAATLQALDHMIQGQRRRDAIDDADLEDTLSLAYESYSILSKVDTDALSELLSHAFQQAGVKKPTEAVFNASLQRFFQIDRSNFEGRTRIWK
ncbi:hypothetical protein [Myroides fluvii]|uniref:hypothetical protein n=1 Tax=Myroides fluvii TaxID=2572594 RepID=UPI001E51A0B1|nr:hypothetical protein [Myroides fluvii]